MKLFSKNSVYSTKQAQFLPIYFEMYKRYRNNTNLVILEVGIAGGGSLFFWRSIFGPTAKIIGIDLNPECKKYEDFGFEIYIGSQSDKFFLEEIFQKIGGIDIFIDDGGHTNYQQILTLSLVVPFMKENGEIYIEDLQCSFHSRWGNPSKYSTLNFVKRVIDSLFAKNSLIDNSPPTNIFSTKVYSITFIDSLVMFKINQKFAALEGALTSSGDSNTYKKDYRYSNSKSLQKLYLSSKIIHSKLKIRIDDNILIMRVKRIIFVVSDFFIRIFVRYFEFLSGRSTRKMFKIF